MARADRESAVAAEFDVYLDALGDGSTLSTPMQEETVSLGSAARAVRSLDGLSPLEPRRHGLPAWDAVRERAEWTPMSGRRTAGHGVTPRIRFSFHTGAVATAALVLLTLVGSLAVFTRERGATDPATAGEQAVAVYLNDEQGFGLLPLDPLTLLDDPAATGVSLGTPDPPTPGVGVREPANDWLASADGSTLVAFVPFGTAGREQAIVFDLPGEDERARFEPDGSSGLGTAHLTADGSRLVVEQTQEVTAGRPTLTGTPRWTVYDTATGGKVHEIVAARPSPTGFSASADIDAAGTRLYALSVPDAGMVHTPGPWPVQLDVYDLGTGEIVQTLDLPGIIGGVWAADIERPSTAIPVAYVLAPAIAISPGGDRLAVLSGDGSAVVWIAVASMTVEGTVPLDLVPDLLAATPEVAPSNAALRPEAYWIGAFLRIAFAPDGRVLISGYFDQHGPPETAPDMAGLTVVSANGEVPLLNLPGFFFVPDQPAGNDLYLMGVVPGEDLEADSHGNFIFTPIVTLYRLDAASFAVRASRTISDGFGQLVVIPEPAAE